MTKTQQQVLQMIAKFTLENPTSPGISAKELLFMCVDHMIVHNAKDLKE